MDVLCQSDVKRWLSTVGYWVRDPEYTAERFYFVCGWTQIGFVIYELLDGPCVSRPTEPYRAWGCGVGGFGQSGTIYDVFPSNDIFLFVLIERRTTSRTSEPRFSLQAAFSRYEVY